MEQIIWKRMIYHGEDLGDFYLVSNTGEIKNAKTNRIRKKNVNHQGYYFVVISLGSIESKCLIKIHRAVAETYLANPDDFPVINHRDGNKLNNYVDNLEFCNYQDNTIHAYKNGLIHQAKSVICLNNNLIFNSVADANEWCGLSRRSSSIFKNIRGEYNYAGRHPDTNEKLSWAYYETY